MCIHPSILDAVQQSGMGHRAYQHVVTKKGVGCPSCGNENITTENSVRAGGEYTCTLLCETCKSLWRETFVLVTMRMDLIGETTEGDNACNKL